MTPLTHEQLMVLLAYSAGHPGRHSTLVALAVEELLQRRAAAETNARGLETLLEESYARGREQGRRETAAVADALIADPPPRAKRPRKGA